LGKNHEGSSLVRMGWENR